MMLFGNTQWPWYFLLDQTAWGPSRLYSHHLIPFLLQIPPPSLRNQSCFPIWSPWHHQLWAFLKWGAFWEPFWEVCLPNFLLPSHGDVCVYACRPWRHWFATQDNEFVWHFSVLCHETPPHAWPNLWLETFEILLDIISRHIKMFWALLKKLK